MARGVPPWQTVYQQGQRWIKAGVFKSIVHDLRGLLRVAQGRTRQPTAVVFDSRTLQSTPESGGLRRSQATQGQQDAHWRRYAGQLAGVAGHVGRRTRRRASGNVADRVQQVTGENVELAFVDQGYTGTVAAEESQAYAIRLEVVKLAEAKKGFILLARRWVVGRTFGWAARFRRLARDDERLPETLAGRYFLAFAVLRLKRFVDVMAHSS